MNNETIKVIKRDGRIKDFDTRYIDVAISKAEEEVKGNVSDLGVRISELIKDYLIDNSITVTSIEDIQDLVVEYLKQEDCEVAKGYKEYRDKRTKLRKHPIDKQILDLMEGTNEFLAKENANKNSTLISTQRDLMAGTVSRDLSLRYKIPKFLVDAHNEGLIKLHDLDYFLNPMSNCELVPLNDLFEKGTVINNVHIDTPKSLSTAMTLATQIITQVTSFTYGGCSISLSHLAPFVRVSKNKIEKLVKEELLETNIQATQEQIDTIVNTRLKKEIKDSVQTFNYQVNTMSSTNGQSPFVTIFIYLNENPEYKKEVSLLAEEFFKQRIEGMPNSKGNKVTQTFPKILFTLDEDNIHETSEYNWLLKLALKCTAKRMCPDYISAKVMKELYGDVFPVMGCVDGKEIITYKYNDLLYVESFERMWNRFSQIFEVKEQQAKGNYYIDLSKVYIYDTKEGFVDCKRIIKNNSDNWVKIKMTNGRVLTCTDDHPFATNRGRVLAKDLTTSDFVRINSKQYCEETINFEEDLAWLFGVLICDGCLTRQLTCTLGLDEKELVDKIKTIVKNKYGLETEIIERHRGAKGNYYELHIKNHTQLREYLINLFNGVIKNDRQIPNEVFSWNYSSKLKFLAGMIDADGYINNSGKVTKVQLGSVNKELSLQQMALMQSLGMKAVIYENHYNGKDKTKIRYRVECIPSDDLINALECNKKKEHFSNNERTIRSSCDLDKSYIKQIIKLNNKSYSYDVTTSSDHFEVSGIYSHNCRSLLFPFKPDGKHYKWYGRCNLGVCTINIVDIALTSKGNKEIFWKLFDERMEKLVKPACLLRYDKLKGVKAKVAPLLWQYGVFARLNAEDYITDALDKIGYSISIGYNGVYEVTKIMTGQSHTTKEGFEFAKQVVQFLNDKAEKWKSETGKGFSVYQTPQEESTDWFCNKLKNKFGIVKDVTDKGYITNSYHIDVREPIDIFSKFTIEGKLQEYSKGGNVAYAETSDLTNNIDALYEVIKHMYNTNIHAEINNEGSCKCFKCGYEGKMDYDKDTLEFICPQCKNRDLESMSIVLRVCGYLSSKGKFIAGRFKDIINRVKHLE